MTTPFIFGKVASAEYFTNRTEELNQLIQNFNSLLNTIIISPRRWGKSSLVKKAANITVSQSTDIKFCFIDMYNIRSEDQFYQLLSEEILKASASKMKEILEFSRNFLSQIIPKISFSPDVNNEFSISADWEQIIKQPDEILDLAENIAKAKNIKFIICIDEFQNISDFKEPVEFQKKLRSHWQHHQNVGYCLYGSKRHMLLDVFSSQSMPFYKFGNLMFLDKISEEHWIPFIIDRFSSTGKNITAANAGLICKLVENHSFYVQQLAHLSWVSTENECKKEIILNAHEKLLLQLSYLYQTNTDGLSNTQIYFLHALLKGEEKFSSKDMIKKYKLGTSANVSRIKQALENKEVIEITGGKIDFNDPVYKSWLKEHYFQLR
ncbi:MAG TPA: hypothetical protein VKA10_01145 [Prolixibacteraceae bacterium]|nr:hypothetical protein [Prolixibacteraceae bacterium]